MSLTAQTLCALRPDSALGTYCASISWHAGCAVADKTQGVATIEFDTALTAALGRLDRNLDWTDTRWACSIDICDRQKRGRGKSISQAKANAERTGSADACAANWVEIAGGGRAISA